METLPVEIVSYIFEFLPSLGDRKAASQTCKQWYGAYLNPRLRNHEVVEITTEEQLQQMRKFSVDTTRFLHFRIREIDITEHSVSFWQKFGPHMKSLAILNCDVRERTFIDLVANCRCLETLTIQNCRELFMSGRLFENDEDRKVVSRSLAALVRLNLSYNRYLSDSIFVKVVSLCPRVANLMLSGCQISFHNGLYKKYYPNGNATPSESVMTFPTVLDHVREHAEVFVALSFSDTLIDSPAVSFLAQVPGLALRSLRLRSCQQLSNEGLLTLSKHQKSLTELDVGLCPRVTDQSLIAICAGLVNLRVLCVQRCRAISDIGIASLSNLRELRTLNISDCELIQGPGIVAGLCQSVNATLLELRMSNLGNVSDEVVVKLAESLPRLTLLDLGHCYSAVTDRSVQAVLTHNTELRHLVLAMCHRVTDRGLTGVGWADAPAPPCSPGAMRIPLGSKAELDILRDAQLQQSLREMCENASLEGGASLKNLKGLESLNLSGCNRVSDVSLRYALRLKELRTLDLSHCQQVSADGLQHMCANNAGLESLSLENCHNVCDEAVAQLVSSLPRLRSLVVGSVRVTDRGARAIARHATLLTYLDIRQCDVSEAGVEEITRHLPDLKNFHYSNRRVEETQVPSPPIGLFLTQKR